MHEQFKALVFTHKIAPIEFREQVALDEKDSGLLLSKLQELTQVSEAFVLSTCNRTEIYYSSSKDLSASILAMLCLVKGMEKKSIPTSYYEAILNSETAVKHLFEVSLGLDAQIIGDLQIINQVKKAYQLTADLNFAGPFLHRLLHAIFFANKKIQQETSFRDGAASVSYAAADFLADLTQNYNNPTIVVAGLGEIGIDTVKNLVAQGFANVYVANRNVEKAAQLSSELGIHVLPFEMLHSFLVNADALVSCVSSSDFLFDKTHFEEISSLKTKFILDLGVPRNVHPNVEEVNGVLLYNLDQIQQKVNQTLEKRQAAIPQVREIMEAALAEFADWSKEMAVSPTINKLKNALEQIRKEEMTRFLKQMDEEQIELVDKVTKSMMQKIMKMPVLQLKAACRRGEAENLMDVLNDLFNLQEFSEHGNG